MAKTDLRYSNIVMRHPTGRERAADAEAKSSAEMMLTSPGGATRRVPLDEGGLIRLIADAAKALEILDNVND